MASMERDPRQYIAGEVRAEMARQGHQQSALTEVLGLTRQGVWLKFWGNRRFTAEELVALADFLKVPVNQFLPSVPAS